MLEIIDLLPPTTQKPYQNALYKKYFLNPEVQLQKQDFIIYFQISIMEGQCHICKMDHDLNDHCPLEICSNRHVCCKTCAIQLFFRILSSRKLRCPFCRQIVSKDQIEDIKKQASKNPQLRRLQRSLNLQLRNNPHISRKQKNKLIWKKCRENLQSTNFDLVCQFLQKQIQKTLCSDDDLFIGIGSKQEQKGFSENCGYEWFQNRYNIGQLSLYDQLALLLMLGSSSRKNLTWYDEMIAKNALNYKAIYGLALANHNNDRNKAAFQLYLRIIRINPNFDKPYEMIAFLYLEENSLNFAKKYANQCLSKNPNNIFAQYILISSINTFTPVEVQEKLQKIMELEPTYVRALHLYGNELSKTRKWRESIKIYEKCEQINKYYAHPFLSKAKVLIELKQYSEVISTLNKIANPKDLKWPFNDDRHYYLGIAYEKIGMLTHAVQCFANADQKRHTDLPLKKANFHYQEGSWKSALDNYRKCYQGNYNNIDFISKVVTCCHQTSQFKEKVEWLHRWSSLEPENVQVYYQLGSSYQKDEIYDASFFWYRKCLEKGYKVHEVYPKVVEVLRLNQQCQESFKYAREFRDKCELSIQEKKDMLNQDKLNQIRLKALKKKISKKVL